MLLLPILIAGLAAWQLKRLTIIVRIGVWTCNPVVFGTNDRSYRQWIGTNAGCHHAAHIHLFDPPMAWNRRVSMDVDL